MTYDFVPVKNTWNIVLKTFSMINDIRASIHVEPI